MHHFLLIVLNKIVKLYNGEMDTVVTWMSSGTTYLLPETGKAQFIVANKTEG